MDIKELNKPQLILLTLLITFVVSVATGIVTVSLMQQMPKAVPATINNVIQRTIERVTTPTPAVTTKTSDDFITTDSNALVSIYENTITDASATNTTPVTIDPVVTNTITAKALGEGVIVSDVGLIMVDSDILTGKDSYKVVLNKEDFTATVLKKFNNGFTILKITPKTSSTTKSTDSTKASVDNNQ